MQQATRRLENVVSHFTPAEGPLSSNGTASALPRVLVIGATGTTGEGVAKGLLQKGGVQVVACVRDPTKQGQELKKAGAELVHFDYDKPETFANAFKGIDRCYCMSPAMENPPAKLAPVIAAAKKAGVKFIVRLSALLVQEDKTFEVAVTRKHKACEDLVTKSGMSYCILRAGFFTSLLRKVEKPIKMLSAVGGAAGTEQKVAWIDPRDISDVAVEVLLHPERHTNKTYALTADESFTNEELCTMVTDVLGRPIKYLNLPAPMFAEIVKQNLECPDWQVEVILQLEAAKASGRAAAIAPHDIKTILGRPPRKFRAWLEENKQHFIPAELAKGHKAPPPIPWQPDPIPPLFAKDSDMPDDPKDMLLKVMQAVKGYPNHSIFLATSDKNGRPSNRIVSLKEINDKGISFMTDRNSRKMQDVQHNNQVAGVLFWKEQAIQVRFEGKITQASDQENKEAWDMVPAVTRWNLTVGNVARVEGPGTHFASRQDGIAIYDRLLPKYPEFVTDVPPNECTYYIVPDYWEFWQMNPPFADRVAYEKTSSGWKKVRRSPP